MTTDPQLTKLDLKMLLQLLDELKKSQSNSSCNDLFLESTPENRAFMEYFNTQVKKSAHLHPIEYHGQTYITGNDTDLTSYFTKKLKAML